MDCCYMERFARDRGLQSAAADRNLARLYEKMERYYRQLSGAYDLASWFTTEEERHLFGLFEVSQKAWMHYGMLSERLLQKARESRHLYIYGAGVLAGQVFTALAMRGFVIEGFLVTSAEGNPSALHGRPVSVPDKGKPVPEGTLVIIAVTDGYRNEVAALLTEAGLPYIYYKE